MGLFLIQPTLPPKNCNWAYILTSLYPCCDEVVKSCKTVFLQAYSQWSCTSIYIALGLYLKLRIKELHFNILLQMHMIQYSGETSIFPDT